MFKTNSGSDTDALAGYMLKQVLYHPELISHICSISVVEGHPQPAHFMLLGENLLSQCHHANLRLFGRLNY